MAKFNATGIADLELSMKEFAELPDEIVEAMLTAGGEVVVEAHKKELSSMGLPSSSKLLNSIKAHSKAGKVKGEQKRYVLVYPTGKHHTYRRSEKRKLGYGYKKGVLKRDDRWYTTGGNRATVTNNDVGFILEFGAPHKNIKARQWMRKANEKSADATVAAELRVYDEFLKSKNL